MRPFYPVDFLNFLNEATGQVVLARGVCRGLLYNALGAAMVTVVVAVGRRTRPQTDLGSGWLRGVSPRENYFIP